MMTNRERFIERLTPLAMLLWLVAFVDLILIGLLRVLPVNDWTGGIFVASFFGAILCVAVQIVSELFSS